MEERLFDSRKEEEIGSGPLHPLPYALVVLLETS
jgi:hypothetical protein